MADTKAQASELGIPAKSTDANGWTVYDYGAFKKYIKRFGPSYGGVGALVAAQSTQGPMGEQSGQALPVGITNLNQVNFLYTWTVQAGGDVAIVGVNGTDMNNRTSTPQFYMRNTHTGGVTMQNCYITIELTTL